MRYFVYLIVSKVKNRTISYVGYTNNIKKRINLHNKSKGAKFTRGDLVDGIKVSNKKYHSYTLVTHKNSNTKKIVTNEYNIDLDK